MLFQYRTVSYSAVPTSNSLRCLMMVFMFVCAHSVNCAISGTTFSLKDHLWTLFLYEKGLFKIPEGLDDDAIYDGCHCADCPDTMIARCFVILGYIDGDYPAPKPHKEGRYMIIR